MLLVSFCLCILVTSAPALEIQFTFQDPNLSRNTVWAGVPFDVFIVLKQEMISSIQGSDSPLWIADNCASILRLLPTNCSFNGTQYHCTFTAVPDYRMGILFSESTMGFKHDCGGKPLCFCFGSYGSVGELTVVHPFRNPRLSEESKGMMDLRKTELPSYYVVTKTSITQPTANVPFAVTIYGERFRIYGGEVGISGDNCATIHPGTLHEIDGPTATVSDSSLVIHSVVLPAGQWAVCFRRGNGTSTRGLWTSVSTAIGESANDIFVGSLEVYPTSVSVENGTYVRFDDEILVYMTFPPQTQSKTVSLLVDYSENLCAAPLSASTLEIVVAPSTIPVQYQAKVKIKQVTSVVHLVNWVLSFCFQPKLPATTSLWRMVGRTLNIHNCSVNYVNRLGQGCVACPSYQGGLPCSGTHGECWLWFRPTMSNYQEQKCVCASGEYSGTACEITACKTPMLSLPSGSLLTEPAVLEIIPTQPECASYFSINGAAFRKGTTVTLTANGTYVVNALTGGPSYTTKNSTTVVVMLSMRLRAFPPVILSPLAAFLDALCIDVTLTTNHAQQNTACSSYFSVVPTDQAPFLTAMYPTDVLYTAPLSCLDVAPSSGDANRSYRLLAWTACEGYSNSTTAHTSFSLSRRLIPPTLHPSAGSRFLSPTAVTVTAIAKRPVELRVSHNGVVIANPTPYVDSLSVLLQTHGKHTVVAEAVWSGYRTTTTTGVYTIASKVSPPILGLSGEGDIIATCPDTGCVILCSTPSQGAGLVTRFVNGTLTVPSGSSLTVAIYADMANDSEDIFDHSDTVNATFYRLSAPMATPPSGTYVGPLSVSLTSPSGSSVKVWGSTHLTTPGRHTITALSHPVSHSSSYTLPSPNVTFTYDLRIPLPPVLFEFNNATRFLVMTCASSAAAIMYGLDGRAISTQYVSGVYMGLDRTVVTAKAVILGPDPYLLPSEDRTFVVGGAPFLPSVDIIPIDGVYEAPLEILATHPDPNVTFLGNATRLILMEPGRYSLSYSATKAGWGPSAVTARHFVVLIRVQPVRFLYTNSTRMLQMMSATQGAKVMFSLDDHFPYILYQHAVQITQTGCLTVRAFATSTPLNDYIVPSTESTLFVCNSRPHSVERFHITSSNSIALWALHTKAPIRDLRVPFFPSTSSKEVVCSTPSQHATHFPNQWMVNKFHEEYRSITRNASECGDAKLWVPNAMTATALFDQAQRSLMYAIQGGPSQFEVLRSILEHYAAVNGLTVSDQQGGWRGLYDRYTTETADRIASVAESRVVRTLDAIHELLQGIARRLAVMALLKAQNEEAVASVNQSVSLESVVTGVTQALQSVQQSFLLDTYLEGINYTSCALEVFRQSDAILTYPNESLPVYGMGLDVCRYNVAAGPLQNHPSDVDNVTFFCELSPASYTLRAPLEKDNISERLLAYIPGLLQLKIESCKGTMWCLSLHLDAQEKVITSSHVLPAHTEYIAVVVDGSHDTVILYSITNTSRASTLISLTQNNISHRRCEMKGTRPLLSAQIRLGVAPISLLEMFPLWDIYSATPAAKGIEEAAPFVAWLPPQGTELILDGPRGNATVWTMTDLPVEDVRCSCSDGAHCVVGHSGRSFTLCSISLRRHRCIITHTLGTAAYTLLVRLPPLPISALRPTQRCFTSDLDSAYLRVLTQFPDSQYEILIRPCDTISAQGGNVSSLPVNPTTLQVDTSHVRVGPSSCLLISVSHPEALPSNETTLRYGAVTAPAEKLWMEAKKGSLTFREATQSLVHETSHEGLFLASILTTSITALMATVELLRLTWLHQRRQK